MNVSVPLRGFVNLKGIILFGRELCFDVSVPLRGFVNLKVKFNPDGELGAFMFQSPCGDSLIWKYLEYNGLAGSL